jgi:polyhydroxybutyrate depolymerase
VEPSPVKSKTLIVVFTLLALPAVAALFEAVSFHIHNQNNGLLISGGKRREYLLHVPARYDGSKRVPLVISLHGAGGWPAQQRDITGWDRVADSEGFIVVYPAGADNVGPRVWHDSDVADTRFIADLIDHLEAKYDIDPERIYANGFSNGGGMSFVLSCTLPDRIAAVGLVGAANLLQWRWCKDTHAIPMISFHGTADRYAPYYGGISPVASPAFPSAPGWAANWARRNRCASNAIESSVAADVTRRAYVDCADHADVVLYTLHGGGHTWPGGKRMLESFVGTTSQSIDATKVMWDFFNAHPAPRARIATAHSRPGL